MTDHYATLGVPKDADAETIKRAYRKLSSEHHPDREGGDAARMAEINTAYETLSDPGRREHYNNTGDSNPSQLENEAERMVMALVLQLLDNEAVAVLPGGIFQHVCVELMAQENQLYESMQAAERRRLKFVRTMKRLRWNGDSARRDFMRYALQNRIDQLLEGDRKATQHLEVLRLAQRYANAYELTPDMDTVAPFIARFLERGI